MTYVLPLKEGLWKDADERARNRQDAERAGQLPICDTAAEVRTIAQNEGPQTRELHVYAHGNQGQIGKYSANEFYEHLKNECDVNNPIRRTQAIILHSCMSAAPHENSSIKPLGETIHQLMWNDPARVKRGKQVMVVGYHSRTFTDVDGRTRCLDPVFWDELDTYEQLFRTAVGKCTSNDRRRILENKYLLSPEDSRRVFRTVTPKEKGANGKLPTNFSFASGGVKEPPKKGAKSLLTDLVGDANKKTGKTG